MTEHKAGSFVRFVVGADGEDHRQLNGLFTEARILRDGGHLSVEEDNRLERIYDWFNLHLPVPPFSERRWRKGVASWFKSDATEPVSRMWDIVVILRDHGVPTRMLRSDNPGKVVYEDDFQVVVEEWRNL